MEQNLNEETLLLKARAGDDLALEELINIYRPVVNRITRGYFLTNGDDEDLVQEGMIGLYKAIQTFSLSSEAKFQTFAYLCIKRQVLQAVRSSLSSKNAPLNNYLSIDSHGAISFVNADEEDEETEFYIPREEPSPEDNVIKKETSETEKVTIGGRFCESGDILIENITLPKLDEGDILCVYNTGAYNYSMASNYNRVEKPAMVLVNNGESEVIVKRETLEDLVRCDVIPNRLRK